jgi:hypothetical protein
MSKRASARVRSKRSVRVSSKGSVKSKRSARAVSKHAFARVDPFFGLVAHSPEVLGMATCLDSPTQTHITFGAYCFKLNFTPVAVIANPIPHPDDTPFGPKLYTAGPNVTGKFTKDNMDVALNARLASKTQPS